jgi:hypothetical protein
MRVTASEALWRVPASAEFYVYSETSLDLNDDFSAFPEKSATPLDEARLFHRSAAERSFLEAINASSRITSAPPATGSQVSLTPD